MNNINIDFDELFEDLKAHNYYNSYKREIVKNALIEYARENDLSEFNLGATVECGCIEFDTKTQKTTKKHQIWCFIFVFQLISLPNFSQHAKCMWFWA